MESTKFYFLFLLGCLLLVTRGYCTAKLPIASYDEVKDLPNHPEVLLIDVREPNELQATGQIPTSINIPLSQVKTALSDETLADVFQRLYGHVKPRKNDPIIVYCTSGVRSEKAQVLILELSYTNVKSYKGSWNEWADKNNLPK